MNSVPLLLARSVAPGGEIARHASSPDRRGVNGPVTAIVDLASAVTARGTISLVEEDAPRGH